MDGPGEFDWRQHHKSLGEQLWYMYQFEIETDLEINLYNDQIRKVWCMQLGKFPGAFN